MLAPTIAHQNEYYRLLLSQDQSSGIEQWWNHFAKTWDSGMIDVCQQMLVGTKSPGLLDTLHSQAIVLRCQGLVAMLSTDYYRAEVDFRRSLAAFRQTTDDLNTARTLNDLGTLYQAQGDYTQALTSYEAALEHINKLQSDSPETPMIHNNLGQALVAIGELERGTAHLEQARDAYRQAGISQGMARVQVNLGQLYRRHGEMDRALATYQEALEILQNIGDQRMVIDLLNSLGVLYRHWGQLDIAGRYYKESLALAQSLGDLSGQCQALGNIGTLHQLQGKYAEAAQVYREALLLYESMNDVRGQAQMWGNLGHIHSFDDEEADALSCYERSLDLYRKSGDQSGVGTGLVNLAGSYRTQGRFDDALSLYAEAVHLGRQQQDRRLEDAALGASGTLHMMKKEWDIAAELFAQALERQRERGDVHAQVETMYKQGLLASERGDFDAVLPAIETAWEIAMEQDYGRWLFAIAMLMGDTAEQIEDPGAFNYYVTAVLAALKHQDSRRFVQGVAVLKERIQQLTDLGRVSDAHEFVDYLVGYCHDHPWAEWAEPLISRLQMQADRLS
ncbi:MAG: tetratricopeptide repeat protein [Caldilineaceae bacterium]|nr:tetratricopeptide repeat protein [Caldilineaceae bacterium]